MGKELEPREWRVAHRAWRETGHFFEVSRLGFLRWLMGAATAAVVGFLYYGPAKLVEQWGGLLTAAAALGTGIALFWVAMVVVSVFVTRREAIAEVAHLETEQPKAMAEIEKANAAQVHALRQRIARLLRPKASRLAVAKSRLREWAHALPLLSYQACSAPDAVDDALWACKADLKRILGAFLAEGFDAVEPKINQVMGRPVNEDGSHGEERWYFSIVHHEWGVAAEWLAKRASEITESDLDPGFTGTLAPRHELGDKRAE